MSSIKPPSFCKIDPKYFSTSPFGTYLPIFYYLPFSNGSIYLKTKLYSHLPILFYSYYPILNPTIYFVETLPSTSVTTYANILYTHQSRQILACSYQRAYTFAQDTGSPFVRGNVTMLVTGLPRMQGFEYAGDDLTFVVRKGHIAADVRFLGVGAQARRADWHVGQGQYLEIAG